MTDRPLQTDAAVPRGGGTVTTIDFRCAECGKLLQVRVRDTVQRAKCPFCGAVRTLSESDSTEPPRVASNSAAPNVTGAELTTSASDAPGQLSSADAQAAESSAVPVSSMVPPRLATHDLPGPDPRGSSPFASTARKSNSLRTERDELARPARETPTKQLFDRIVGEIGKLYVGQEELVLGTLVAMFSAGHVLIESVPGLGKTLFVRALGRVLGCRFGRIQFTADLMPSDITGAPIFDMKTQEFRFRPGPVFTQLLLADEINRSPAKTHAALLEIMQEYRVTVDGESHPIERPFLVLATQNPIESEGTYNLPEAQLDRFMFKLVADYPDASEEAKILSLHSRQVDINQRLENELRTVTSPAEIIQVTAETSDVYFDEKLIDYVNRIVRLTREWPQLHMGASPRAGIALMQGARTLAAFYGRDYAVPDDVVQLALPALRHRVILTAEAEVEGHNVDELLTTLFRSIEVPRI